MDSETESPPPKVTVTFLSEQYGATAVETVKSLAVPGTPIIKGVGVVTEYVMPHPDGPERLELWERIRRKPMKVWQE